MKLREIMTWKVKVIDSNSSVKEAAALMKQADVGMLPVIENGNLVGVVTDRDLVIRAFWEGNGSCPVKQVMSLHPVCINRDFDVSAAIDRMQESRVSRLIVKDETDHIVGVLSVEDIAVACNCDQRVGRLVTTLANNHRHAGLPTLFA